MTLPFSGQPSAFEMPDPSGGVNAAAVYESEAGETATTPVNQVSPGQHHGNGHHGHQHDAHDAHGPQTAAISRFFIKLLGHALGLIFIATGLLAMGTALLTPAVLENQKLQWDGDLLRLQADRIAEQHDAYQSALIALEARDEALLEQLAISYLNLKPLGSEVIDPRRETHQSELMLAEYPLEHRELDAIDTIEAWLHRPMPKVGKDIAPLAGPEGWLAMAEHLTFGNKRIYLFAIGGALTMLSLLLPMKDPQ